MTDEATADVVDKTAETTPDTTETATADVSTDNAGTDTAATDTATGDDGKGKETAENETASSLPDDWRELASNGDEDALKLLKRYGSLNGVVKALVEKDKLIRSGKIKRDMPDPKDEKAMAEWRKAEGIPDDPSGYSLPDTVKKVMTDADKPMLASFTDYAHKKGAPQAVVDIASEWYFDMAESAAAEQSAQDQQSRDEAETELRKDWAHGEYKANTTLAKRFIEGIPGVGDNWTEARMPDGRLLGSIPEFIQWASDQGRQQFGDVTFANSDSERKHTARREEIEKIRDTDFDRYENEGLDKELRALIEKDIARGKR